MNGEMITCISVATASFYYWTKTLAGLRSLESAIRELVYPKTDGVMGFELHGTFPELLAWNDSLKRGECALPSPLVGFNRELRAKILTLSSNSVHLPNLAQENSTVVADFMNSVHEFTGVSRFVVHPNDTHVTQLVRIADLLHPNISISIENMDPRKESFRNLEEIESLLELHERFSITLDICHYVENGYSSESDELLKFISNHHHRIKGVHFSVPTSQSAVYKEHSKIETTHYLASDSQFFLSQSFFDAIPDHAAIVIEGVVPQNDISLLNREIALLHTLRRPQNRNEKRFATIR